MTNFVWFTELYGSMTLILVGAIIAGAAIAHFSLVRLLGLRVSSGHAAMIAGLFAAALALILCGLVGKLVFDGHTGIERVIGNLFVWVGSVFSLGIGVRAARTVSGYPEHGPAGAHVSGRPRLGEHHRA